jgi:hypothetical protein
VKCWQRFAAWAWDNIPGGVPAQNVFIDAFPELAAKLDELAFRRDRERTSRVLTHNGRLLRARSGTTMLPPRRCAVALHGRRFPEPAYRMIRPQRGALPDGPSSIAWLPCRAVVSPDAPEHHESGRQIPARGSTSSHHAGDVEL